jgi:hypothetical protein
VGDLVEAGPGEEPDAPGDAHGQTTHALRTAPRLPPLRESTRTRHSPSSTREGSLLKPLLNVKEPGAEENGEATGAAAVVLALGKQHKWKYNNKASLITRTVARKSFLSTYQPVATYDLEDPMGSTSS